MLIGIDIGGTFTDIVIYDSKEGKFDGIKVPTTTTDPKKAVLDVLSEKKDILHETELIFHATTIATNALLTKEGLPKVALLTTKGFRDVLEIGRQRRAEVYNLYNTRPKALVNRRFRYPVKERMDSSGNEVEPLDLTQVEKISANLSRNGIESVAIAFVNSYRNPEHELIAKKILQKEFRGKVCTSSDVNPEYREYERISTTVVNATLSPIVSDYLQYLKTALEEIGYTSPIYVMNSSGGIDTIRFASEYPISIIESGPAAGVLASRYASGLISLDRVITFDMGGTTAKAGTIVDGKPDIAYEFEAAGKTHSGRSIKGSGYVVRHPFIDLAEASAGGGTIAWVDDGGSLRVGPQSAGSEPGPAAYGRGGDLATVTDAHVLLGHINSEYLLGGKMPIYRDLAYEALRKLSVKLKMSVEDTADGILKLINNAMSKTISIVSVERGRDPRDFTMMAFGGAGPLHACDMADDLHIPEIVVPPHPGLFSAYGLLTGDMVRIYSSPMMTRNLNLRKQFNLLKEKAIEGLRADGLSPSSLLETVEMRYHGQSYQLVIPYSEKEDMSEAFNYKHKELYGYLSEDPVEVTNIRVHATVKIDKVRQSVSKISNSIARANSHREAFFDGSFQKVPVYIRENLQYGSYGQGPCIIEEYDSTIKVNKEWNFLMDGYGNIVLKKVG